ncbi:uncharacterized protein LOC143055135 [Mytilus galloprovincialis]|uniref:uncharacterized protein LOC143055135 n=1 Tax=Mytilus galloprovincialis TaxID=29158 RepID=UPI003F7B4B08
MSGASEKLDNITWSVTRMKPAFNANNSSENSLKIQLLDGIPLGATVSQKIKEKIWSAKFIDMNSLTSSSVEEKIKMYDLYGDEPWRIFDEKYRRLRETIKLPWGKLIDELYTKSANTKLNVLST